MFIDEIIIDGFKSYASRTIVGKFDSKFNAITGLNGSGKSNILDAICFVLGIGMDKVRATNLQDLIYKKGQAGITKASVTIIFNNENQATSPPKYEKSPVISVTRQIILGGKTKYLVNGKNETQQEVSNMFQSVQLNIQNPNFLIMQGKITHVLNMKPQQILGMVEEAAGTRLYEDRKEKAIKIMEKKDLKLAQSTMLLETEISPKLDELREKKRSLLEYQQVSSEMEQLEKIVAASQFMHLSAKVESSDEKKSSITSRIVSLEQMQGSFDEEIADLESRVTEVTSDRYKNGGAFFELEESVKEIAKEVAKIKTQCGLKVASIKEEKDALQALHVNLKEAEEGLAQEKGKSEKLSLDCDTSVKSYEEKLEFIKNTESLVQTLTTGMGSSEGQENGYMDQLKHAKQEASSISSEIQQLKFKLSHMVKELKVEEPKAKAARKENESISKEFESRKNIISMIKEELSSMSYDPSLEGPLLDRKSSLENSLKKLQKEIHDIERSVHGMEFEYSDPIPHFDRSKVKGLVATLVSIPKDHLNKATALEVCAGGKLYQVVVESQEVATQLLQKGKLRRRVTIIPLNKINAFKVQAERIAAAKKLAPGCVDLALSLVGSDEEVSKAMSYVFGSTLICNDAAVAKLVTFDNRVNLKSVTLDGDVYDPSGTLSGGAKLQSSGILLNMQKIRELKNEMSVIEAELSKATAEWKEFDTIKHLFTKRKQELELREHEFNLQEKRMANNVNFKLIQNVDKLIEEHKSTKEDLEKSKEKQEAITVKIASIEKEIHELNSNRESKVESLKKQIKSAKKEVEKLEPTVSKMKEQILLVNEEIKQSESAISGILNSISLLEKTIHESQTEQVQLEKECEQEESKLKVAADSLNQEKKALARFDKELQTLEKLLKTKRQGIEDNKLELQKLTIELNDMSIELEQAEKNLAGLEKQNPWIKDQRKLFGVEGGLYDFSKVNVAELSKRIKVLKSRHSSLSRTVDTSALELFDRVEKKEIALKQKLSVVQKDKTSITSTLEYLDRKKLDQLNKTWRKVNGDFGAIFGDLLPGNTCKLEPPQDMDITQGLEIKVCLGGVWKSSLTELSGGQRSLIALSLILALLQFNPAPMYILDEVDAALDLSHTQNIGKLLKTRFKTSQFILVSLKDGMYNNANVLFRTKFVDGVSQVTRQEQQKIALSSPLKKTKATNAGIKATHPRVKAVQVS